MSALDNLNYAPRVNIASDWQAELLDLLKVLDKVCSDHGITYSIAFGGLLGAVRHRGFIPWDNDVDIVMDERNYNRLRDLALADALPEGYAFVDRATEPDYPLLFGRFVDLNTSCPLSTSSFNGGTHGLFVDVFILFPLPDDAEQQEDAVCAFLVWEQLMCRYKRRSKYRNARFHKRWRRLVGYQDRRGREKALERAESEFRALIPEFEESTWCFHGSGGAFNGFGRFRTEWFVNPVRIPFEDAMLCAPSDPVGFFEQRYGGGWRECPSNESFHTYSGADLNIPGPVISEDYMQLIDQEAAVRDFFRHTDLQIRESALLYETTVPRLEALAELHARSRSDNVRELECVRRFAGPEASQASPEEAKSALGKLKPIVALMQDKELARWRIVAPIDSAVLSAVLWAQFLADPRYWEVAKVIESYRADEKRCTFNSSEANTRLERALGACGDLYRAIDFDDGELLGKARDALMSLCPTTMHAATAQAWAISSDPVACLAFTASLPADYRKGDYLALLEARCLFACNRADEGAQVLGGLAARTNNGMVMLAINDLASKLGLGIVAKPRPIKKKKRKRPKNRFKSLRSFGAQGAMSSLRHHVRASSLKVEKLDEVRAQLAMCAERIDRYHAIRRLSSERFKTWETMYPRRELVREAIPKGPDAVMKVARAYIEASYRVYDGDGFGLYVDELCLQAGILVFLRDRGQEFVDDFLAKIPEQHKEDIDVMLKRKGVDHPYFRSGWSATAR